MFGYIEMDVVVYSEYSLLYACRIQQRTSHYLTIIFIITAAERSK